MEELPMRPDQPATHRGGKIVLVVVATVVAMGIGGAVVSASSEQAPTTTAAVTEPTEVAEPVDDFEVMRGWWSANEDEFVSMQEHFSAVDLAGAAEIMNTIDAVPDPEVNALWIEFKADINEALIRFNSGDIVGATRLINNGTDTMNEITAAIEEMA